MKAGTQPPFMGADPRALQSTTKLGFDTSSLSFGIAAVRHAVRGESARKGAVGAIGIAQAAYLPLMDLFVVDDRGMHDHLSDAAKHAQSPTRVVRYTEVVRTMQGLRHGS
jgi:hypothetical protein